RIAPLMLTEGAELTTVTGFSAVAGLPDSIARRQAEQATSRLEEAGLGVTLRQETWPGGPGTVVGLWFHEAPVPTLFFGLGARGKRAEAVADEAVDQALAYRDAGAPVDLHSTDQISLPLALSEGESRYRVSEVTAHLTTNLTVIGRFLRRRLECVGEEGGPG